MEGSGAQRVEAFLAQAIERLRRALSPLAIYLYGSYAYGSPRTDSDIDLLVVGINGDEAAEAV